MYTVFYIYRIAKPQTATFLRIQAAAQIYLREGALDDATYAATDQENLYGCLPLNTAIALAPDEDVLIGVSTFRDRAHHDAVMARVDADPQIEALYAEVQQAVNLERVVRGAFERVV